MDDPFAEMYYDIVDWLLWFKGQAHLWAIDLGFLFIDGIVMILPARVGLPIAEATNQWAKEAAQHYEMLL